MTDLSEKEYISWNDLYNAARGQVVCLCKSTM